MSEHREESNATQQLPLDTNPLKLAELLDRGCKLFEEVESTQDAADCSSVQVKVRRGIHLLEEASRMVKELQLFSGNEDLEEIATSDLKFLLLPALLGALTVKLSGQSGRSEKLQTARTYYMDFLKRCQDYKISQFELPKSAGEEPEDQNSSVLQSGPGSSDLVAMAAQRNIKIERYRQKKELEARLAEMQRAVDSGQADDEVSREFYVLSVRRWVGICLEEIQSVDMEVLILKARNFQGREAHEKPPRPARAPMKNFILTKTAAQAQVFGPGYPSLPTMTVDEWYEEHQKHGALPDQGIARRPEQEEEEEEEEEKTDHDEDEESLHKARSWDDWKDTHRRGYGNRQNMG
ncbi:immunoglobulin-binding protein 1 [Thalassophryne amazonica]|uniref:immunoglobulin-binding protein 1 n=1 Tax=Thalassophryne amazonica TaxID=390379 RepID=UPI001471C50D|nr:immunoglobulin-binding protein 1 [Thalassophryne amazonica]